MTSNQLRDLRLTPTGDALGVVVENLDLTQKLAPDVVLRLKQAVRDHHIVIYKRQDLSEAQFKDFASYFGSIFSPPANVPVLASGEGGVTPEIVRVSNVDGYTGNGELTPHADHQWTPYPSAGSFLYALEVPRDGGDTSFYNMHLAYETLDDATKARIANRELITYNPFLVKDGDERPRYRAAGQPLISPVFPHPLVRTHPESGKKTLFLGFATEVEVVGLSREEGTALVEELRAHFHRDKYRYRHRWSVGDIVFWDNQVTLHARTAFDAGERRVMKRISLAGSRPF